MNNLNKYYILKLIFFKIKHTFYWTVQLMSCLLFFFILKNLMNQEIKILTVILFPIAIILISNFCSIFVKLINSKTETQLLIFLIIYIIK